MQCIKVNGFRLIAKRWKKHLLAHTGIKYCKCSSIWGLVFKPFACRLHLWTFPALFGFCILVSDPWNSPTHRCPLMNKEVNYVQQLMALTVVDCCLNLALILVRKTHSVSACRLIDLRVILWDSFCVAFNNFPHLMVHQCSRQGDIAKATTALATSCIWCACIWTERAGCITFQGESRMYVLLWSSLSYLINFH